MTIADSESVSLDAHLPGKGIVLSVLAPVTASTLKPSTFFFIIIYPGKERAKKKMFDKRESFNRMRSDFVGDL